VFPTAHFLMLASLFENGGNMGKTTRTVGALVVIVAFATMAALSAAPAGAKQRGEKGTTFVGTIEGTDANIAIIVGKKGAFGYICDGDQTSHWLRGAVKGDRITLVAGTGATVTATINGKTLEGTVLLPEPSSSDLTSRLSTLTPHAFEANKAREKAGLFRDETTVDGVSYTAGWVRLEDGDVKGQVTVARTPTDTTVTTAPPATQPPVTQPPATQPPVTQPPVTSPPPTTPIGTEASVTNTQIGLVAPPPIQALFPPVPLRTNAVTKVPNTKRGCSTATGQYNLAESNWDKAQPPPDDHQGPGSGKEFNDLSAALFNMVAKCGVDPLGNPDPFAK
jgi:hypothetical protein